MGFLQKLALDMEASFAVAERLVNEATSSGPSAFNGTWKKVSCPLDALVLPFEEIAGFVSS